MEIKRKECFFIADCLQLQMPIEDALPKNHTNEKHGISIRLPSLDFQGVKGRIQTSRQKENVEELSIAEKAETANDVLTKHSHCNLGRM